MQWSQPLHSPIVKTIMLLSYFFMCRGKWGAGVCEWSQPQIQPQAPPNFFSQNMFFPFPSINNYCENFLSMECILRFGSVLLINTLQCFLSIISRPRQEPRHHTVKSRLTVFPSYFQSKLRPLCIWIVPGSSALLIRILASYLGKILSNSPSS